MNCSWPTLITLSALLLLLPPLAFAILAPFAVLAFFLLVHYGSFSRIWRALYTRVVHLFGGITPAEDFAFAQAEEWYLLRDRLARHSERSEEQLYTEYRLCSHDPIERDSIAAELSLRRYVYIEDGEYSLVNELDEQFFNKHGLKPECPPIIYD